MTPSSRIRAILEGGSHGWEILEAARAMRGRGQQVVNLTIGEHDEPTAPAIVEAMDTSARGGHTGYAPLAGTQGLREAIATHAQASGVGAAGPENVIACAGGQAALFYAMLACLDPGDVCVIVDPYYATYPGTVRAAGGVARTAPARPDDGFQIDLEALDAAVEGARAVLINSPHNPTGAVYSAQTVEGVAEICRRRDLWLISDEVYSGMVWKGRHLSPRALPGMAERTVVIGSMSKSHAMTGFRLGWAIAPAELVTLMTDLALNAAYGLPGFIQDASEFALREQAEEVARIEGVFRRRRDLAMEALAGSNAVRAAPSDGAMYVMIDVRPTGLSGDAFAHRLLEAERIAVMPGESFGTAAAGHVRVSLTAADEELADALRRLASFAATVQVGA